VKYNQLSVLFYQPNNTTSLIYPIPSTSRPLEQEQRTHSSQLAEGLVSAFDKINILASGDSSRLAAGSFKLETL